MYNVSMTITAKFDGKSFVPDKPVKLQRGARVVLKVLEGVTIVGPRKGGTVGDLLKSGAVGAWAHRKDIKDSRSYARGLRRAASRRGGRE